MQDVGNTDVQDVGNTDMQDVGNTDVQDVGVSTLALCHDCTSRPFSGLLWAT